MLPKKNRLVKEKEIKMAFRTRFRKSSRYVNLLMSKNETEEFQLLVVVSKKIFKKANKRFRIKRRLAGIFNELKFDGKLPSGISCIVQVKNKEILFQDESVLKDDILPPFFELVEKITKNTKNIRVDKNQQTQ